MIKPINDYVFFTISKEYEDELKLKNGLVLQVATQADIGRFTRIFGDVIAVPGKLTDEILFQKETGYPEPKASYSGEMVEELVKYGHKLTGSEYECTPYEREYFKITDIAMEVEPGDRIYFHYNTIHEENKYMLADGRKIYKVRYDQIICVVRNILIPDIENKSQVKKGSELHISYTDNAGQTQQASYVVGIGMKAIIPIGSHVLVSMVWDEGVVDIDLDTLKMPGYSPVSTVKGKLSASGLITELHDKPKHLEGIVRHIGKALKGEPVLDVVPGDKVLFLPDSDWMNVIEGKEYFVMKQRDLIAKLKQ